MKTEKISNGLKNLIALARKIDRKNKAGGYGKPIKLNPAKDVDTTLTGWATDLAKVAGTSFEAATSAIVITCLKRHLAEMMPSKQAA